MSELHSPRVAILASGSGSTAEAFIRAAEAYKVDADVGLVICNNPPDKAHVYDRIAGLNKELGLDIEIVQISGVMYPEGNVGRGQTLAESAAICEKLREAKTAHVALMGYMKMVRGELVEDYGWLETHSSIYQARMSNTHPGPLPETIDKIGVHASEKVLELGMSHSRHTVHLVSEGMDTGPILAEHPVEVLPGDTAPELFERVQAVEKAELPGAIGRFLSEQGAYLGDS